MLLPSFVRHGTLREDGVHLNGPSEPQKTLASEICCVGTNADPGTDYHILFEDILWCELANDDTVVKIQYAKKTGKSLTVQNMLVDVSYAAEDHDIASIILKKLIKVVLLPQECWWC